MIPTPPESAESGIYELFFDGFQLFPFEQGLAFQIETPEPGRWFPFLRVSVFRRFFGVIHQQDLKPGLRRFQPEAEISRKERSVVRWFVEMVDNQSLYRGLRRLQF